jgi:D-alanyl-lipoteichoic acid acyltransferase DltB (MBOAT superfamily)
VKRLVVPLGLSYYIFRTIGYLLDVYWERTQAQRSFSSLVLYISFFPQIVSGPIQRGGDFFGQLQHWSSPDAEQFASGLRRILLGLFRKVVIADQFAELVAGVHSNPAAFSAVELLFAAYCYSFQLYLDFSGLTDMAIGIGLLFGIKGPENFDRPFLSRNIQEFWRRWHMSLTSWLSDYLFFPLGMSLRRFGTLGLSVAIMINMVAVGVWHGPTWTYLDFGILNGLLMIGSVLTLKRRETFFKRHAWPAGVRSFFSTLITFHLVVFTQIWFRANSPQ